MSIKEWGSLLWLSWKVKAKAVIGETTVIWRYYRDPTFFKIDMLLHYYYLFRSAFSISKRFLQQRGADDVYAYGETPLTSLAIIAKQCALSSSDCVYELGCGRGRGCFWLHCFVGCRVVGIDYIPLFIERANAIKQKVRLTGISFLQQDICASDYAGATVLYLYGTCLDERTIKLLLRQISCLPIGTKIITVSYPLTDYMDASWLSVVKKIPVLFPWGAADVFLHQII